MRNYKILLVSAPLFLFACSKGGDSHTPTPPPVVVVAVADIAFKVEIPASTEIDYSKIYGAVGGSQDINVNVTSALPKDGVTIDVKVTKDADNTAVFNKNISVKFILSIIITLMLNLIINYIFEYKSQKLLIILPFYPMIKNLLMIKKKNFSEKIIKHAIKDTTNSLVMLFIIVLYLVKN
jgi:hypothetical protein